MDNIERLYKYYDILSAAGDKISEHVDEYKEILKAVKGSSKEKRLASQFIGNFFKYFPELADTAIDAQLDLCEDDDTQIRRQAIKDLPKLCQGTADTVTKVGDTLAQLLALEDPLELLQVYNSMQAIIKLNPKAVLAGIFQQISTGDETTRERCFKFLANKFIPLGPTIITKELEEYIIEEIKKVLQDVTADEFHLCMNILGATKLGHTITGHAELVKLATEQAELNADIDSIAVDDEVVERFIQCATQAMPYFSNTIKSTAFVVYVCDKLLPLNTWKLIATAVHQDQVQLRLLKVFAEMCATCDVLENSAERIRNIYQILLEYMPLPKLTEEVSCNLTPSFEFSHAECLLYALHTLGKKNPNSLTFIDDADKLKDFRARLQFLARGTQGYIKKLEEALKGKSAEDLKTEENHLKQTALKTTSNINSLIRDLFHSPPIFKHDIQLSWVLPKHNKLAGKRHAPITFGDKITENGKYDDKKSKPLTDQRIYAPPSGKYSAKVQNYGSNVGNGGGGNRIRVRNGGGGGGGGGYKNRRGYKKY